MADQPFNPYQAPVHDEPFNPALSADAANYSRQGDVLVVVKGASLPPEVCLATGERAEGKPVRKNLAWAHPALAIAIFFNLLIYLILYLILRKRGELSYGLSAEFKRRRMIGVLLAIFGPVLSVFVIAWGAGARDGEWALGLGALMMLATLIAGVIMAQPFRIQKIDATHIYLKVKPKVFAALGL